MTAAVEGLIEPNIYDVIAGVGNNEMKSLVFGLLRDGSSNTKQSIHNKTIAMQGDIPEWTVALSTPVGYCETFAKFGVVTKATVEPLTYTVNERGRRPALPLVGHLLDVSLGEKQSLLDFNGPTQTNSGLGVRPCQRRIETLELVQQYEGKKLSLGFIAERLGIKIAHAGDVADDLAVSDIIEHDSSGRGKPTISFTAGATLEGLTLRTDISTPLLFDIVSVLQRHFKLSDEPITNREIATKLTEDFDYSSDNLVALVKKVSGKTSMLASKRQALKPQRHIDGETARGAVSATEAQLATINNLLRAITGAKKSRRGYLLDGHDKLEVIMSDSNKINSLVAKARANSVGLKRLPDERNANFKAVRNVLLGSASPLSIREISTALAETGVQLDRAVIRSYMIGCKAVEQVTTEGNKYSLAGIQN